MSKLHHQRLLARRCLCNDDACSWFHGRKVAVSAQAGGELSRGLLQAPVVFECSMCVIVLLLGALFVNTCSMLMPQRWPFCALQDHADGGSPAPVRACEVEATTAAPASLAVC